jgi:hypothetical protein
VIQSPRGKIVYVVDAAAKAMPRPVEIVYASGEEAVVSGIKPGERVVLDGRQNLRPGATVIERAAAEGGRGQRGAAASAASAAAPSASSAAALSEAGRGEATKATPATPAV